MPCSRGNAYFLYSFNNIYIMPYSICTIMAFWRECVFITCFNSHFHHWCNTLFWRKCIFITSSILTFLHRWNCICKRYWISKWSSQTHHHCYRQLSFDVLQSKDSFTSFRKVESIFPKPVWKQMTWMLQDFQDLIVQINKSLCSFHEIDRNSFLYWSLYKLQFLNTP